MIAMINDLTLDFAAAVAEDLKRTRGEHGYYETRSDAVNRANFVKLPPLCPSIALTVVPFIEVERESAYGCVFDCLTGSILPLHPLSLPASMVVTRLSYDASQNPAVSGGRVGIRQVDDGRVEVVMVVDVDSGEPVVVEAK